MTINRLDDYEGMMINRLDHNRDYEGKTLISDRVIMSRLHACNVVHEGDTTLHMQGISHYF